MASDSKLGIILGALMALLIGLAAIAGLLLVANVLHFSPRIHNTATMVQQVQSLSQLVTVQYITEKIVVLEDPPKELWSQFVAGNNRVILVAHGVVKAGVDLSAVNAKDLRLSGTNVYLRLPSATITDVYLDDKKTQVLEHKTALLRALDRNLEQEARRQAVDEIRRAAKYGGIVDEADRRARTQLQQFFTPMGLKVIYQ